MKYLLRLKYVGDDFSGFQSQSSSSVRTVQGELTAAFSALFSCECRVTGCSRTDSGVHALDFCATVEPLDTDADISADKLPLAASSYLPPDISVTSAVVVTDNFHPRYDVKRKEYAYKIYFARTQNPFSHNRAWHIRQQLPEGALERMREACSHFVGRKDFSSFMASGSKISDATREIYYLTVDADGSELTFRVAADGFLYNMVRIIVGTLVDVAYGKIEPSDIEDIISSRDRARAGRTAPAHGLYLTQVLY